MYAYMRLPLMFMQWHLPFVLIFALGRRRGRHGVASAGLSTKGGGSLSPTLSARLSTPAPKLALTALPGVAARLPALDGLALALNPAVSLVVIEEHIGVERKALLLAIGPHLFERRRGIFLRFSILTIFYYYIIIIILNLNLSA